MSAPLHGRWARGNGHVRTQSCFGFRAASGPSWYTFSSSSKDYTAELPVSPSTVHLHSVPEDLNPAKYCSQRAFLVRMHERSVPLFRVRRKKGSSGIPQDGPRKLSGSMFLPVGKTTQRRLLSAFTSILAARIGVTVCVETRQPDRFRAFAQRLESPDGRAGTIAKPTPTQQGRLLQQRPVLPESRRWHFVCVQFDNGGLTWCDADVYRPSCDPDGGAGMTA